MVKPSFRASSVTQMCSCEMMTPEETADSKCQVIQLTTMMLFDPDTCFALSRKVLNQTHPEGDSTQNINNKKENYKRKE